ncbi:putative ribonuclease H-like domain-containing protein [Tanacetum coccineum]
MLSSHTKRRLLNSLAKWSSVTKKPGLVEAARTMLIFTCAPLFLWAEAIATAYFTQNRSLIQQRFNKTLYEHINDRKPDISVLYVFGALCYPKNDRGDIGNLGAKGLDPTYAPSIITSQKPIERELDLLFEAMYDDYIDCQLSDATRAAPVALASQNLHTPNASTTIIESAPTPTNSSTEAPTTPNTSQDVGKIQQTQHYQQQYNEAQLQPEAVVDNVNNAMFDENMFINPFAPPSTSSAKSSSQISDKRTLMAGIDKKPAMDRWRNVHLCIVRFIDADHPSYVYKLKEALYGLKCRSRGMSGHLQEYFRRNSILSQNWRDLPMDTPIDILEVLSNDKGDQGRVQKLRLLEIDEDLFAYDTQLGMIFNEFNRGDDEVVLGNKEVSDLKEENNDDENR